MPGSLRLVIFFRIFAGPIFKIQIAQIFVNRVLALTQKFQPCLLRLLFGLRLGIENINENANQQRGAGQNCDSLGLFSNLGQNGIGVRSPSAFSAGMETVLQLPFANHQRGAHHRQ